MRTPGLHAVGVEASGRQRCEGLALDLEAFARSDAGAAMGPGVHALIDPELRPGVEVADRAGQTGHDELFEERLLQILERALHPSPVRQVEATGSGAQLRPCWPVVDDDIAPPVGRVGRHHDVGQGPGYVGR